MTERLAFSLVTLRDQLNQAFPGRSKESDGWIGDPSHQQRHSDHNPNPAGVVCAIDVTNDPRSGLSGRKLAEYLLSVKDPRLAYVISNKQIASATHDYNWAPYNGANTHEHHVHISVKQNADFYDNPGRWRLDGFVGAAVPNATVAQIQPTLRRGDAGAAVEGLQHVLNDKFHLRISVDGRFGSETETAIRKIQADAEIPADGIVGPLTRDAVMKGPLPPKVKEEVPKPSPEVTQPVKQPGNPTPPLGSKSTASPPAQKPTLVTPAPKEGKEGPVDSSSHTPNTPRSTKD